MGVLKVQPTTFLVTEPINKCLSLELDPEVVTYSKLENIKSDVLKKFGYHVRLDYTVLLDTFRKIDTSAESILRGIEGGIYSSYFVIEFSDNHSILSSDYGALYRSNLIFIQDGKLFISATENAESDNSLNYFLSSNEEKINSSDISKITLYIITAATHSAVKRVKKVLFLKY